MLIFIIAASILIVSYSYIGLRLIVPLKNHPLWRAFLWSILIVLIPVAPCYLIFRNQVIGTLWQDILPWIAYLNIGFFCLVFTFLIIRDVALLLLKIFEFVQIIRMPETTERPKDPERRNFMIYSTNLAVLGVSGALSGYGLYNTRNLPDVITIPVPVRNLPNDLEEFRIIQITDTHINPTMKKGFIKNVVDRINNLNPDLIAFTGDLADGPVSKFKNEVAPLKDLSAAYGSYFVTGNHEYYEGIEACLEEVDQLGFTVLLNENRVIKRGSGSILLAGITDFNAGRFFTGHVSDPNRAISGAPESSVKILLAHQPRSIFAAAKAGFDLQISGHTHGGQIYPWQLLVYLQQPYLAGLHRYQKTWIYVSRGTGYWGPPLRIGAPSEISVITLTKQKRIRSLARG